MLKPFQLLRHFHRKFYVYNSRKMEGIQELIDENIIPKGKVDERPIESIDHAEFADYEANTEREIPVVLVSPN